MSHRKNKNQVQPTFTVELTETDKSLAHVSPNKLKGYGSLWGTVREHRSDQSPIQPFKLYELEGYAFYCGTNDDIFGLKVTKKEYPRFKAFAQWCMHNAPSSQGFSHQPGRKKFDSKYYQYMRFPDGTWVTWQLHIGWFTIDLTTRGSHAWDWQPERLGGDQGWATNHALMDHTNAHIKRFLQVEEKFEIAWKIARKRFVSELRESGELFERFKRDTNEREVEWTKARMDFGSVIKDAQDELEDLARQIQSDAISNLSMMEAESNMSNLSEVLRRFRGLYRETLKK